MEYINPNKAGPIEKYTLGSVHVTIWKNIAKSGEPFHSVKIENRYKDEEGNWKSSNSFSKDALPVVVELASKAHDRVRLIQSQAAKAAASNMEVQR